MSETDEVRTCALCKNKDTLQMSHIIPSFVGKWIKNTSVTGFLRQAISADIRRQDIPKKYLLCKKE